MRFGHRLGQERVCNFELTHVGELRLELERLQQLLTGHISVCSEESRDVHHVVVIGFHQLVFQALYQELSFQSQSSLIELKQQFCQ